MPEPAIFPTINQKTDSEPTLEEKLPDAMLFMAMEDLDASIILYYRGLYPQAVFSLQQAVEKLAKSMGFFLGIISEKESIKRIKHQPLKIVQVVTSKLAPYIQDVAIASDGFPEFRARLTAMGVDVREVSRAAKKVVHDVSTYLRTLENYDLSNEELGRVVADVKDKIILMDRVIEKIENQEFQDAEYDVIRNQLVAMYIDGIATQDIPEPKKTEWLKNMQDALPQVIPSRELLEEFVYYTMLMGEPVYTLFQLARITAPHENRSRYPTAKDDFDPLEYYTADCPLVKVLPDLHQFTRVAIERIDFLYDLASEQEEEHHSPENAGTLSQKGEFE